MEQIFQALERVSVQFGTGNVLLDLTIVATVIAALVFFAALLAWALSKKPAARDAKVDRFDMLLGRLERTERTIHEFRTDVLRGIELLRADMEFARGELENVRVMVDQGAGALQAGNLPASNPQTRERRPSREELATRLRNLPGYEIKNPAAKAEQLKNLAASETQLSPAVLLTPEPLLKERTESESVLIQKDDGIAQAKFSGSQESGAVNHAETEKSLRPASTAIVSLAQRLDKTRKGLFERFRGVFSTRPKIDAETIDELEAILVGSDLGVKNIRELLAEVRQSLTLGQVLSEGAVKAIIKSKLLTMLEKGSPLAGIPTPHRNEDGPVVILVVGVNGAGKTTTAAKLAGLFKKDGAETLLVAADTFRAAAVEQLHEWGRRLGVAVISGADNAKPQTVVFDAMERAMAENVDCVIIDTAGRLHTKQNLMDELSGIRNAIERHLPGAPHEILLVIDGSTGQNGLNQAREFNAASGVTGLVVTKLDGTSKGGILVAIKDELGIPVRYIGTGERVEDLEPFSPRDFVEALFAPV